MINPFYTKCLNRALLLLLVLGIAITTYAQSSVVKKEFKTLSKLYTTEDHSYSFTYSYTDGKNSNATQNLTGSIKKKGEQYVYELADKKLIRNNTYILIVDQENKALLLDTVDERLRDMTAAMSLDSMFKHYNNIKRVVSGSSTTYTMNTDWNGGATLEMKVNNTNWHLQKINVTFTEKNNIAAGGTIELNYSNVQLKSAIPSSAFSLNKYLIRKNNTFKPTPSYQNWVFVNHLE